MTSLEMGNGPNTALNTTSAAGAMRILHVATPILLGCCLPSGIGTSATAALPGDVLCWSQSALAQTSAGTPVATVARAGAAIGKLRRTSGLAWEQLARLFAVSRRALHFWASGKPMTPSNEEHLQRLLAVVGKIDRGSAQANRAALLGASEGGIIPLDLLAAGSYDRVVSLLGGGTQRRTPQRELDANARRARDVPSPEELVGALNDRIGPASGKLLASKSLRIPRRS